MANTKAGTRSRGIKAGTDTAATSQDALGKEKTTVDNQADTAKGKQYKVKRNLDPHMIVPVKNGFQGRLIYKSKRTNERFEWESFGDEQELELQELKNAKSSSKTFFINNWFLIDDPEVLEYLGVTQYYKYALNFDSFNDLFTKDPEEIKEVLARLSEGQKKSVAYRAKQLIADGVIDSIKVITALEDGLSIELIDR